MPPLYYVIVLLDGNLDDSDGDASGDEHEQPIQLIHQPSLGRYDSTP